MDCSVGKYCDFYENGNVIGIVIFLSCFVGYYCFLVIGYNMINFCFLGFYSFFIDFDVVGECWVIEILFIVNIEELKLCF